MRPTFLWRDEKLNPITEEEQAHFVVIPDSAEREETGNFSREFTFRLGNAPETPGGAYVHDQDNGKFALFGEFLYVSCPETGGHIPIDRPNLVTGLIFADIFKVHPASLE